MNTLQPEQTFAQYRIVRRIGVGGMATVFQAVDKQTRQRVALKVLHEQWSYHDVARKRFELEAAIGNKLQHPGIVPILGYGVEDERPYIVMKYMSGENLADEFRKQRSIRLSVTGKLLTLIASALDYAHDRGVVHRDLKLENILLDEKRRPAISDFGIAKLVGTTRMTMTGQMIGTPQYMAPELLDTTSDQIDKYVDLYAFAVMAYLMATGYFPFTSTEPLAVVLKHKNELAPIPTEVNPKLPRQLNPVLLRGLQKNPADRYPSAQAFAEAFNNALVDKAGHTTLIFMNDYNPVQGRTTGDSPPANLAATPYFGIADADMLERHAHEPDMQSAEVPVSSTVSEAETHSVKRRKRSWLFIAAGILTMTICGGGYVFTQDNSFIPAPAGSYSLPTATLLSSSLYSSQVELNAIEQTEMVGDATPTSTSEAEVLASLTATVLQGRTFFYTTNTPLPTNTAIPVATVVPIIVYPSNTPLPPANTQVPVQANTPVPPSPIPPTPVPVIPTDVPVVPTIVEVVPTVVEIIPTEVNVQPTEPVDGGGGNGDGNSNGNGGGNGNGNGNSNGGGNGNGNGKSK